jgi:NADPH:quinone reductase-like Zn-dependent oxidoreductase
LEKFDMQAALMQSECWAIHAAEPGETGPAQLRRESLCIPEIGPDEVLAEPLYGCWEANMTHGLERRPIDICRRRSETRAVLGNSGVLRILGAGSAVTHVREGDVCLLAAVGSQDSAGYVVTVLGYDAPGTVGLLTKRVKLHGGQVVPLPKPTRHSLARWAGFSVRYSTAWDNWRVAYGCWRLQMSEEQSPRPHVWSWGGGVGFAELTLAKYFGCRTAMIASMPDRLAMIAAHGITAIDRRAFPDLEFDPVKYDSDRGYRRVYLAAERKFLNVVNEHTFKEGVSIFIDNIGAPVQRATLRALGRQGVLSTTGWKHGMDTSYNRAVECIERHIFVHTHASRNSHAAMYFAEETGWLPPEPERIYEWDEIPALAEDYAQNRIESYFPVFRINPE